MAVLITTVDMPSGCRECKLNRDTICSVLDSCVYDETNGSTRRPDCPLVEVPERKRPDYKLLEEAGMEL